jgi:L-methionine (R)-S-oxide reductase
MNFDILKTKIRSIIQSDKENKLKEICRLLRDNVEHYDWVGFYLVEGKDELVLGPFVGEDTEHKKIKFGQGICGQAAEQEKVFIVPDVSKEDNYLSCSPKVVSEIVVPIFKNNKVIGEIDIDSHKINPFTDDDQKFLQDLAEMIAPLL